MNEIKNNRIIIVIVIISLIICTAVGSYIIGRNHILGTVGLTDTNKQLERTISELGQELKRERDINIGLKEISGRERAIINRIERNTQQARDDIATVISISGTAAESIQNIIAKMEILNGYIRNNERDISRYRDLSGDKIDGSNQR